METVLLCHRTRAGRHFDWLLDLPCAAEGRLWTGRVHWPSDLWPIVGAFLVEEMVPHRRVYLSRQGTIGGGRGSVVRVDRGAARLILRTPSRIVLDVAMRRFRGRIDLHRITGHRWRAVAG